MADGVGLASWPAAEPAAVPLWTARDTATMAGVLANIPADMAQRRIALAAVETAVEAWDGNADLRCRHALLLDAVGRTEEARQAYLVSLRETPGHAATLNGLGALLNRTGYRAAARTVFAQVTACHPRQALGHVNLANVLREDRDLSGARRHYEVALLLAPGLPEAHQGLGQVLADIGDPMGAERHWQIGYRDRVFTTWPYRGEGAPIRVLLLASVVGGNVPLRALLDDRIFEVVAVATEFATAKITLPQHDVVLNAIGDADLCGRGLSRAAELAARTNAPIVNHPHAVKATGRLANVRRFAEFSGVVTPGMALLPRELLQGRAAADVLRDSGFAWPMLLRAPGFHTGAHFLRVDTPSDLADAVAALPGEQLLAIDCLDAAGADGLFRKGRVLTIDGALYPLHWAISADWMVHYCSAGMATNPAYRAEEARFLLDMEGFIGAKAFAALRAIAAGIGLDYGGIDFGIGRDGDVLLFEANATMAIVPPSPDPIWDYRRPAITRATDATQTMFEQRATAVRRTPTAR